LSSVTEIFKIWLISFPPFLILGDFNSHNPLWGSVCLDDKGKIVENLIDNNPIFLFNHGSNTYHNVHTGYSSAIDFINMPTEFSYLEEIEKPKLHRNTNEELEQLKSSVLKIVQDIIQNSQIIEDQLEVMPIKGANEMLANQMGKQEYQAFAYCLNHGYQIITEDKMFNMLFVTMKLNIPMTSNSLLLLEDILNYEELRTLRIELHAKRYKNVLDKYYMHNLITFMQKHDIHNLGEEEKELIKIVDSYGWINKTKEIAPISTNFDENYKKLLNIIDTPDSALYKQLDLIDDGKM